MKYIWYALVVLIVAGIYGACWALMKAGSDYDDANGMGDENKTCYNCKKHGTMNCPNSSECYSKDDKPYFTGGDDE